MKVSLISHGTRGDIQPVAVLAAGLSRRGHEVVLGAPSDLTTFGERLGLTVVPLAFDTQEALDSPRGRKALASGSFYSLTSWLSRLHDERAPELDDDVLRACKGAELIVAGFVLEERAAVVAEHLGVPLVLLHSHPVRRSRRIAHPLVRGRAFRQEWLNLLTHLVFSTVWWGRQRAHTARFRRLLGLPPDRRSIAAGKSVPTVQEVQIYSRHLVAELADEWAGDVRRSFAGFIRPDERDRTLLGEPVPDGALGDWLDAGEPPVYVGFGSMPLLDAAALVRMVAVVCRSLGVRALLVSGQPEASAVAGVDPAVVRVVRAVEHETVLPRMRAAVVHGGAGTVAATLRAGLPTMVCSFFVDQAFWGARIEALGVGAQMRYPDLTAARLEAGLRTLLSPQVAARTAVLAARLRAEPEGVAVISDLIDRHAARDPGSDGP